MEIQVLHLKASTNEEKFKSVDKHMGMEILKNIEGILFENRI